jgi:D-alanine-D-alanine ligase
MTTARRLRVAVPYDASADALDPATRLGAPGARPAGAGPAPDVAGVREAVDAVVSVLRAWGHDAFPVPVADPMDAPAPGPVDLIFNLVEGVGGRAGAEAAFAAAVEATGIPLTGAGSHVLALCLRKDRVNAVLSEAGVSVPPWTVVRPGESIGWDRYPAIVKPVSEDGSVGIDDRSVVSTGEELGAAVARLPGPCLVQAFVDGPELAVGVVGGAPLPVAEQTFAGGRRLVTYAAKWHAGSRSDRDTPTVCPARIPDPLRSRAVELALRAWRAVGGGGYGRVDLRADTRGRLHVLDVNPNPDLSPGAGLVRMAAAAGWSYAELVRRIVDDAAPGTVPWHVPDVATPPTHVLESAP